MKILVLEIAGVRIEAAVTEEQLEQIGHVEDLYFSEVVATIVEVRDEKIS